MLSIESTEQVQDWDVQHSSKNTRSQLVFPYAGLTRSDVRTGLQSSERKALLHHPYIASSKTRYDTGSVMLNYRQGNIG